MAFIPPSARMNIIHANIAVPVAVAPDPVAEVEVPLQTGLVEVLSDSASVPSTVQILDEADNTVPSIEVDAPTEEVVIKSAKKKKG